MSDKNFADIKQIAYRQTGITLTDHKKNMIYGRLARRLRSLGLKNFNQYCELIAESGNQEMGDFVNSITTNLTAFFREGHHFEFLEQEVFPALRTKNLPQKRVRIWSAGCSTGEEPYSLSIVMQEHLPTAGWDVRLLATDLDTEVVAHARRGVYSGDRVDSVSEERRQRWFLKGGDDQAKVKPQLQKIITFKPLNLLNPWPFSGPFDVIFCRNVVIYFDKDTQKKLFNRYADILADDGYLFIGHSESLHRVTDRFRSLGRTIYQKVK
ncbi:protein-glutamate O-methyltransferase CheR [Exilibacterium tricleocarpae]|uniref:Chemotaxis protein methyltransferase n=2 Tax=Exilibacterium tricleocarpae TaxID=2591008 RepID=A0A545U4A2_9GAMM|nr:protein-glutamate O-methyltransferase CheR [Exilibacterium tricleocarpae]